MVSIVRKISHVKKMISIDLVTSSTQNEGDTYLLAIGLDDAGDK